MENGFQGMTNWLLIAVFSLAALWLLEAVFVVASYLSARRAPWATNDAELP